MATPAQGQYVVVNSGVYAPTVTSMLKVEYSKANITSVKGLSLAQLVLGAVILVFHIITTAINDHYIHELRIVKVEGDFSGPLFYTRLSDHSGTGIWVGIVILMAASIGIAGYKQQKKGLIVTQLVLNVLLLLCYPILMGTLSATIEQLNFCRKYGSRYYSGSSYGGHHWSYNSVSTTTPTYWLLGEKLSSGTYHCRDSTFKAWLSLDCIILICTIVEFIITLALLIYNCIASCFCCRRTGCCGRCCCKSCCPPEDDSAVVAYSSPQPSRGMVQMQAVPANQVYLQNQGVAHAAPQLFVQQPVSNPVYAQPAVTTQPPPAQPSAPGAQANTDGKWQELPPNYDDVAQGQPQ